MKSNWANGLRGFTLLLLLLGAKTARAQEQVGEKSAIPTAEIVSSVRVIQEDGKVLDAHPAGLPVEAGKPLQRAQVAASIRALYKTGDYADLRAVLTPEAGGVRLDFVAQQNLFLNQVIVTGLIPPPTESSAVAAMQMSLGQTYRSSDVNDALERLRDALREEGLYQANVSVQQQAHPETHQMDVTAVVVPGPRVRLGKIELLNDTEFSDSDLLKLFKLKPSSELTIARVQSGTGRIRKYLEKKGHLSARVSLRRGEYKKEDNSLPLTLEVTEGPLVQVAVMGAKFSNRELKKLVPIYQEGSVDADLLEEGKKNLRERLEREGYFDATVDYAVAAKEAKGANANGRGTEETITYKVDRGARHKLLRIEFLGNHYFATEVLQGRLAVSPNSLFVKPRFSRRLLDSDVLSMKNLYADNGFLEAKVEGEILDDYEGRTGDLVIRFKVQEGKQTLVSSVKIEGMKTLSEEQIRNDLRSSPGQPYSDFNVATDRDNILAVYFNQGFPNASFSWKAEADPSAASNVSAGEKQEKQKQEEKSARISHPERGVPMKLVYHIDEGLQIRVRRVLLTGYNHTRPGVINREVRVKPGEPVREGDVVTSQQKLYNLGIFNRVTIEPQNPDGSDPDKDMVVQVEEAKRYTIAYGGGFEVQRLASTTSPTGGEVQASPRGILEVSKQNITGRADSLALKLRSSTIQGRALLAYTAPDTLNNPKLSTQATAYIEKSQDINTFTQTRYEGNLQLTEQLTSRSTLLYRYAFRKVVVSNLNIPAEEVPLFNQPTLVSEFSTTWFRDTRNNPADASKGSFNTADFSVADTGLGSSASFMRFFLQNSTYSPFRGNFSFARSLRIGILVPYRDTVSLSFPAPTVEPLPTVIPLPERLFAGGGTSLRGFALNQAGPRDAVTGFPVGGQALLVFNQEVRFPLKLPFIGTSLGGALFYDGGNVYSQLSRLNLRWSPPKPVFQTAYPGQEPGRFNPTHCAYNCTNELSYFSHTIGFGLRYATPVGPIRVDLGYQLNPAQFVIPCKNSVPLCQQGTRLPKFQIFFNLGSSF